MPAKITYKTLRTRAEAAKLELVPNITPAGMHLTIRDAAGKVIGLVQGETLDELAPRASELIDQATA